MKFGIWPWQHWAQERGEQIALRLEDQALNWQALCSRVDALAGGFHQQGLKAGDGVALRAKNSSQALLAWLALLQCGARILPLNPQLPDALLGQLLPSLTLSYGLALNSGQPPVPGLPELKLAESQPWGEEWQPSRLASMTLTSGSTGLPKAAVHTASAHLASAAGVLAVMDYRAGDSWLLSLPMFHVSGQGIFWRWLYAGGELVVRPSHPLAEALRSCTHASLVPTQLWRLLEQPGTLDLREVLLGGAAIPVELTQQAESRGIRCWCGYGLTELASTVCAKRADGQPDVGEPLPGREVKIVDEEVWLRAESLASGYWRSGELVPLVNDKGWFATRDRGVLLDGRLAIVGRLDNLFFSGGEGIQPEEVERVIAGHAAVQQVFVVPVDDVEFGQRPVAVVELAAEGTFDDIAAWLDGKLPRFQLPVRWLALPQELKQGGIKISRRKLTEWVAGE
ncbi:2-succinylbenzoate--CoA ligase [Cedecea davisae]|uniref:O-succinylbenzoate-CoA ligase n=1 Tax=Cedecea davisae DSM 4568 TaxID=566551 RepID=S3ITS9_9ENTR|nr:o-succinylbenzoate--CoA ligase [Cedecea davisae]EPF15961.1 O-succinylbenzoate-CoA ligase [Cedecea davisae DSM 4568]SUX38488.1 2-succinylbenzoate--CoA ligase [Cedecea davisae]